MKNESAPKLNAKPTSFRIATESAIAARTASARPAPRQSTRPGPVLRQVIPTARLRDDVRAKRSQREPGPEVRGRAAHLLLLLFLRCLLPGGRLLRVHLGLLVAPFGHQLANGAARRAELDRHDARIADDLAAERTDALLRRAHVRHFHGEMVDAGPLARDAGLRRLRARVVLDEREVDRAVAQVTRRV